MERLNTTKDVVERLGGDDAVAAMFDVGKSAVWNWKKEGQFPARLYFGMRMALAERDCEANPKLWNFAPVKEATK